MAVFARDKHILHTPSPKPLNIAQVLIKQGREWLSSSRVILEITEVNTHIRSTMRILRPVKRSIVACFDSKVVVGALR